MDSVSETISGSPIVIVGGGIAGGNAAATLRERLEPEVSFAHDLHLRRRGAHAVAAPSHHGVEQVPALVRLQLQQAFVDCGHGDLAAGGRCRAVHHARGGVPRQG